MTTLKMDDPYQRPEGLAKQDQRIEVLKLMGLCLSQPVEEAMRHAEALSAALVPIAYEIRNGRTSAERKQEPAKSWMLTRALLQTTNEENLNSLPSFRVAWDLRIKFLDLAREGNPRPALVTIARAHEKTEDWIRAVTEALQEWLNVEDELEEAAERLAGYLPA